MRALHACLFCCLAMLANCQEGLHEHEDHDHDHQHDEHQMQKGAGRKNQTITSTSNATVADDYKQTILSNLNNRFASMRGCHHPGQHTVIAHCQCLWDVSYLTRIVNKENNSMTNSVELARRRLSTLMLYNVLRMNPHYDNRKMTSTSNDNNNNNNPWVQCFPTEAVCDEIMAQTKRTTMLTLLMPATVQWTERMKTSNVESQVFAKDLEDLLQRLDRIVDKSSTHVATGELLNQKCFDTEEIVRELGKLSANKSSVDMIEAAAMLIVDRLAAGQCIELMESRFLKDIIQRYSGKSGERANEHDHHHQHDHQEEHPHEEKQQQQHIDEKGLKLMLNDLHIGGLIENTAQASSSATSTRTDDYDHQADKVKSQTHKSNRGHRSVADETHSHNHIEHQHRHRLRSERDGVTSPNQGQGLQAMADAHQECLDYHFYINQLKQQAKEEAEGEEREPSRLTKSRHFAANDEVYLTPDRLQKMAPILLQQIVSRACERLEPVSSVRRDASTKGEVATLEAEAGGNRKTQKWEAILYGVGSVLVISLASLMGVLVVPFRDTIFYAYLIYMLIGLAYGAMTGDALLHLLPSVLGLHSHDDKKEEVHQHRDDHEHGHEHDMSYLYYMIGMLATMYGFFLFESILNLFHKGGHSHGHSHPHGASGETRRSLTDHHQSVSTTTLTTVDNFATTLPVYVCASELDVGNKASSLILRNVRAIIDDAGDTSSSTINSSEIIRRASMADQCSTNSSDIFCGLSSLAAMVTFGDSVHNLFDGIAIGLAFSNSISSGISTSIAVMFHELPHEFGDFAVLLSTGLSVRKAMLVNFLSAITAFAGLFIGTLLGENETANRVALTFTAGSFLYIGLAGMIPELKNMRNDQDELLSAKEGLVSLMLKTVGIVVGIGSMVMLALFEDEFNFL